MPGVLADLVVSCKSSIVDTLLNHTPREGPNAMGYKGIWDKRNLAPNKRQR